ncbi:hypothetical protein [Martelella sp. HB161492]|uniref:cucumopine synthase-related protein n=1 Tax=Martelella sp. HB161492 TaxID=2720726 RepID=UPI001590D14F|nr:hypothetical protein [Martelella sp. HB161492]
MKDWQKLKSDLEAEIDAIWLVEPLEVEKLRRGVMDTGAGSGGQVFSVMVHLESFLMLFGANVFFRFVRLAHDETLEIDQLRATVRAFVHKPFNVFEFIGDLGLHQLHDFGNRYIAAMDELESREEFIALTGVMMTYIIRMHRWIHFYFPWNLGVAFPHHDPAEFGAFSERMKAVNA